MSDNPSADDLPIMRDHRRQWRKCRYVYPVIARRSKGLSIGVNLNPDKRCTFACVYCQIDRRTRRELHSLDLPVLRTELREVLDEAISGRIWNDPRFAPTPPELRRINDIAFSGDGEPTIAPQFDQAVSIGADVLRQAVMPEVKLVVITNATQFDQPQVHRALPILDANNGEIWAKLDAGSDEYFCRVNHPYPRVTLAHILKGIAAIAKGRHIVIQSLFCRLDGVPTPEKEILAYCDNVGAILKAGGGIKLIQVHTVARAPASAEVTPLANEELDTIARHIRSLLPVPVETYYGAQSRL
jgi:wyosine [tRNA(Phe)-imidazoG37] synthetase (radical SAM superfamily)